MTERNHVVGKGMTIAVLSQPSAVRAPRPRIEYATTCNKLIDHEELKKDQRGNEKNGQTVETSRNQNHQHDPSEERQKGSPTRRYIVLDFAHLILV
jgi:hypothetical protein